MFSPGEQFWSTAKSTLNLFPNQPANQPGHTTVHISIILIVLNLTVWLINQTMWLWQSAGYYPNIWAAAAVLDIVLQQFCARSIRISTICVGTGTGRSYCCRCCCKWCQKKDLKRARYTIELRANQIKLFHSRVAVPPVVVRARTCCFSCSSSLADQLFATWLGTHRICSHSALLDNFISPYSLDSRPNMVKAWLMFLLACRSSSSPPQWPCLRCIVVVVLPLLCCRLVSSSAHISLTQAKRT